ncbi:MAG: TRAM domain-containing protein [Candidatus Bathyarchaeota archaeon]|jgi:predicted RNA-binding protein with TRAM domain|nr:MAG: TRAM domain-containing protein [Candidatus Bathyarchaeota archaeon]
MSYSYSGRRGFGFNRNQPVEVDKEYEARIEEISTRGDGIAKIEGFVIFVPNTKQGEQVKFKVTRVGNRFAIGELVQA